MAAHYTNVSNSSSLLTSSAPLSLHDLLLQPPNPNPSHCGFAAMGGGGGVHNNNSNMSMPALLAMRCSADECESKSSSGGGGGGGGVGASGDDDDEDDDDVHTNYSSGLDRPATKAKKKKRYHRHSQYQIQEMERVFKECPHPDEKQRLELSRELKLDPRQVKFWFQNKRTQVKAQHERHDNAFLRTENEKLRAENLALRDAIANVTCPNCGGPASLSDSSFDDHQLRLENVRLREEIDRISKIAAKHVGRPLSINLGVLSSNSNNSGGGASNMNSTNPTGGSGGGGGGGTMMMKMMMGGKVPVVVGETERAAAAGTARAAMEELTQVAHAGEPLWQLENNYATTTNNMAVAGAGSENNCSGGGAYLSLNYAVYRRRFPEAASGNDDSGAASGLRSESSRQTATVAIEAASLVQLLMNVTSWANMFCSIVSRALPVEVLCSGSANTQDGAMQIIYAEFQMPSPLVSTRESYFLRYSKRMSYNSSVWAVVDVSLDNLNMRNSTSSIAPLIRCRRRPSGCIIEDLHNGYSKITWVEHSEVDDRGVHRLFEPLVSSGLAFGAQRWVAILQRQCEAMQFANNLIVPPSANASPLDLVCPTVEGRHSLLKLAERMTNNFCGGVSASITHTWITLSPSTSTSMPNNMNNNASSLSDVNDSSLTTIDDVRVLIRKSVDDPGRPPGVVLCAATSIWLPVAPSRVFDFLRDEHFRMEWDILSNMGPVEEIVHVPKGQEGGNNVSLLRVNGASSNQPNMLILQECCAEEMSYMVVYAPVDIAAMGSVLNGGDPDCVALLPSGFSILPDRPPISYHASTPNNNNPTNTNNNLLQAITNSSPNTGSVLTVAFQILVDHVPTAKLSLGSVATVNNLISSTVLRIKNALTCDSFTCSPPFP